MEPSNISRQLYKARHDENVWSFIQQSLIFNQYSRVTVLLDAEYLLFIFTLPLEILAKDTRKLKKHVANTNKWRDTKGSDQIRPLELTVEK